MQQTQQRETNNLPEIIKYEINLWDQGFDYIIGVDEVGRGCIAGPLVTVAVVWDKTKVLFEFENDQSLAHKIRDSKKISKNIRYKLSHWIIQNALTHAKTEIPANIIDEKGIQYANREAMIQSVLKCAEQLPQGSSYVAFTDYVDISDDLAQKGIKCFPILHGDNASFTIASASIVAKVHRDAYMNVVAHNDYPEYGFDTHVGYGTSKHFAAINANGISPIHRKSFLNK